MSDVTIPRTFESYPIVRVVWFGQGAGAFAALPGQPQSVATVHSATDALGGLYDQGGYELSTNDESDIASLSWNKDTESPAGVLSLMLFPRRDYKNIIRPDDVLLVYGKADKYDEEKFIALVSVDTVNETRSVAQGATVTRINVQGRDLGKILMETPTVFDAAFGGLVAQRFYAQFLQAFTVGVAQGGPSVVVQTMLAIFFSLKQNFVTQAIGQTVEDPAAAASNVSTSPVVQPLLPWRFPGNNDISMFEFVDTKSFVQTPMVGALIADASLIHNASNLWSLCDMYANRIVNEFFIDTRDLTPGYDTAHKRTGYYAQKFLEKYGTVTAEEQVDQASVLSDALSLSQKTESDFDVQVADDRKGASIVALVHRQLPYDTYSFYSLPTTIVYETEVFTNNTGYSSHDVCNMFRIRFPGIVEGVAQDLQYGVYINRNSIERHGLRRYEGESIYIWTNADDGNGAIIKSQHPTFAFYQSLVTTWYAYNEYLQSGSMMMRFRPDIRVGTRLTFVKTDSFGRQKVTDYYVQRVQHMYSPNVGASRTTVDLVRGIDRVDMVAAMYRESHLFWTDEGGKLDPNPYEVVISEDVIGAATGATTVPVQDLAPGDP